MSKKLFDLELLRLFLTLELTSNSFENNSIILFFLFKIISFIEPSLF